MCKDIHFIVNGEIRRKVFVSLLDNSSLSAFFRPSKQASKVAWPSFFHRKSAVARTGKDPALYPKRKRSWMQKRPAPDRTRHVRPFTGWPLDAYGRAMHLPQGRLYAAEEQVWYCEALPASIHTVRDEHSCRTSRKCAPFGTHIHTVRYECPYTVAGNGV